MGGRGGSGGVRSGKNFAVNAKMPQLVGSEKQVRWAESIRESMLLAADVVVRNAERTRANGVPLGTSNPSVEGARYARKDVVQTLQNVTEASQIIDARKKLTQNYIEKIALEDDRIKNRRKR